MAKLRIDSRGVRIVALASILGLVGCGSDGGGTGEGGSGGKGGAGGLTGSGGSSKGGAGGVTGSGGSGTGGAAGLTGAGGAAGVTGTGGVAGVTGTGGTAGTTGSGGAAGATGSGGAAGATGSGGVAGGTGTGGAAGSAGGASGAAGMDAAAGAAGSGPTDAGIDMRPDGGNGGPCTGATGCGSGFCVDGVCCETACTDLCMACASGKTGAADGLCRGISAGTDPDNECDQSAASTCGLDGTCDGAGACRKYGIATVCAPETCSVMTDTPAHMCDGAGTCKTPNGSSCGNYLCGATSCKTTCLSNADCATGTFCASNGHCVPPQANGATCTAASQCSSAFCVDGVCCESACAGACSACSASKTGGSDGHCLAVTAGTDPDDECALDAASTCGHDGTCDGAGACRLYGTSAVCAGETCTGATDTPSRKCDGAGTCLPATTTSSCGAYVCGASSCLTSCGANTDCAAGDFCSAGSCMPQETTGTACGGAGDCQSGFCVDGVCCNTACTGICMTCDGVGTIGQCTPGVSGTDIHNDCSPTSTTSCGNDGTCDGAGACRKWGAGTVCGVASCASATLLPIPTCNGTGSCVAGAPSSCGVYQCSASGPTCGTSCAADTDCNSGFCSAGTCIASNSVTPVNLAGNGDAEYNAINGWSTNAGVTLVVETGAGLVHGGTYSIADTARTANYMGPAYAIPTGAGKYNISLWGMQNTDPTFGSGAVQLALNCASPSAQHFPVVGNFGVSLPSGVWTKISGTVDLTATAGCDPSIAGGVVDSVALYLNQTGPESPTALPDLYADDLVVTVTDGHNLVGNPNFEAGTTAGWSQTGGSLAITTAQAHGGTNSMVDTTRTQTYQGPKWNLPLGAAKYNVVFYALHTGSLPHSLMLEPTYTCLGGSAQFPASVGVASNVVGGTWNQLSAAVTFPPANAPAGCKLIAAGFYVQQEGGTCGTGTGQIECPDIYIDDVSITLAP